MLRNLRLRPSISRTQSASPNFPEFVSARGRLLNPIFQQRQGTEPTMEQLARGKLPLGLADQLRAYIHDRDNQPRQDEKCEDGLGPYAKPSRLLDPIISRKLRDESASHAHPEKQEQSIKPFRPTPNSHSKDDTDYEQEPGASEGYQTDQEGFRVR